MRNFCIFIAIIFASIDLGHSRPSPDGTANADSAAAVSVGGGQRRPNKQPSPLLPQVDQQPIQPIEQPPPQITTVQQPQPPPQTIPSDTGSANSPFGFGNGRRPVTNGGSASASSSASSSVNNNRLGNSGASANSASSANVLGNGNASASSSSSAVAVGK